MKICSRWLTKSIKPQIDPEKKVVDVRQQFDKQINKFLKAIAEVKFRDAKTTIECTNFLEEDNLPCVNLIITSPPYVTSYEYADLHQLSSLWLEFTDDYRKLRKGSIGSIYNSDDFIVDMKKLNTTGKCVVEDLEMLVCQKLK